MVAGLAFLHSCSSNKPRLPHSTLLTKTKAARRLFCCFQQLLLLSIERKPPLYQTTTNRKERFLAPSATETTKMNTTSLVLTGRPAAGLTITLRNPSKSYPQERASLSSSYSYQKTTTTTPTPPNTPTSSPALRPKHLRRISSDSTGWYLDADTPSLQDFEARAQTLVKRFEKFANRCATNVVMGLMSPAAVVLIVFNPIMLALLGLLIFAMLGGWS
jgi:hypothetical protein